MCQATCSKTATTSSSLKVSPSPFSIMGDLPVCMRETLLVQLTHEAMELWKVGSRLQEGVFGAGLEIFWEGKGG